MNSQFFVCHNLHIFIKASAKPMGSIATIKKCHNIAENISQNTSSLVATIMDSRSWDTYVM